ncbi:hypothetical protein ABL78_2650 [Leptomonas seymouri]|uniref:Uncharacterized protein n=1 Tax=Leptomonas seymouri TaxID=5684 RepID=A0A0N0P700_LEPSE|nr:hypothetical protein ABL78_2650 [Leptomonas seymouri]|eukprot:KPI88226.1 hypothetical protein ABL78_2650 [Leptomonas seymouri]
MPNSAIVRITEVVKAQAEVLIDSPPAQDIDEDRFQPSSIATAASCTGVRPEVDVIRRELDELKRRRADLEAQRKKLLEGQGGMRREKRNSGYDTDCKTYSRDGPNGVCCTSGFTTAHRHSGEGSAVTMCTSRSTSRHGYADSTVLANLSVIPSEKSRRQRLKQTPELGMKTAMSDAAKHDSTLLMGSFLPEDNPRGCVFGRERRFRAVVGQRGKYYLSTDVGLEQQLSRASLDARTYERVAKRYDQTPGPGAYTPLFSKVSRPPRFG